MANDKSQMVMANEKKKYDGEERRERVQEIFEALKKQHGTKYINIGLGRGTEGGPTLKGGGGFPTWPYV